MSASPPAETFAKRSLRFENFDAVLADVENLRARGYRSLGKWDLGQILRHLNAFMRYSLEGFPNRLPGFVGKILRPLFLDRSLKSGRMPGGIPTLRQSVFPPSDDAETERAIEDFRALARRLVEETGPTHPSPLFGPLTRDEWRLVHLVHAAHHLGFLTPNPPPAPAPAPVPAGGN